MPRGGHPLRVSETPQGFSAHGSTEPVAFGDVAASVLLPGRTERGEDVLLMLETQALARGAPRVSSSFEGRSAFELSDIAVVAEHCRPWSSAQPLAFQAHGAVLRSMQMVGAMQRCVELGLQYAAERVQFGRAIGRFAPVQDMLVEAAAETAAAIAAAGAAVEHWQLDATSRTLFCAAAAKSRCGEAAGKVSALVHQVHGAIGFTQEHVLHQFTRRLWAWRDDFGSESFWNRWLGERACASTGSELWPRISAL
jgi:acyl-CoA dehydrogenase